MKRYAILVNPGHNRTYFEAAKKLSIAEFKVALKNLSCNCSNIKESEIAEISYIIFSAEKELSDNDILILSKLSFTYAIFEIISNHKSEFLKPVQKIKHQYMDSNISSILKYTGKTNEIFTRMMINVGLLTSNLNDIEEVRLLDPVAGKGTTLYEGLIYGYNVYGIEIGDKIVGESFRYMKKYLEKEKYKHLTKVDKIYGLGKNIDASRYRIDIAKTKEELKGNDTKHFEIIAGNTIYADKYYRKNFFHLIVGDLPYGVQHGNVTQQKQSSLTRNPEELMKASLDGWYKVLKKGGIMVLAWNTYIITRKNLLDLIENAGFSIYDEGAYIEFKHIVDQSIKRDIIVAEKL